MGNAETLIKWPGGKSGEIKQIEQVIPKFDRYIEPFFGGGALFFHLRPEHALINDISGELMDFYAMVKAQDRDFERYLLSYADLFERIQTVCDDLYDQLLALYDTIGDNWRVADMKKVGALVELVTNRLGLIDGQPVLDLAQYRARLGISVRDKFCRTKKNETKRSFRIEDLKDNLKTAFTGGTYLYFRDVYNGILLGDNRTASLAYRAANYYFIREYCYGSMFRYNLKGEFNIPYGGLSYNRKDFRAKIGEIFCDKTAELFSGAQLSAMDFQRFIEGADLKETDFMFLDPPYDTDFSDYAGCDFTANDQRRLVETLRKTKAPFILIVKNTDFIYSLYEEDFHILCFPKTYAYNMLCRNHRQAEHLIISNRAL